MLQKKKPTIYQHTRSYSDDNIVKFKSLLREADYSDVVGSNSPDMAYHYFINKYQSLFKVSFPIKTVRIKPKYIKKSSWMTKGQVISSLHKCKLYKKIIKKSLPGQNYQVQFLLRLNHTHKRKTAYASLEQTGGTILPDYGSVELNIELGPLKLRKDVTIADIKDQILLGIDIGKNVDIVLSQKKITINHIDIPCEIIQQPNISETVTIPPYSEVIVEALVDPGKDSINSVVLIEPIERLTEYTDLV